MFENDENKNPIIPSFMGGFQPMMEVDPLAILAKTAPKTAGDLVYIEQNIKLKIAEKALDVRRAEARYNALASISHDHRDILCSALASRPSSYENFFRVHSEGGVHGRSWFATGESGSWTTTVEIGHR